MTAEKEQEAPKSRVFLVAGLTFLALAGGLWLWSRKRPCGCGERQVEDIARASAELSGDEAPHE